METVGRLQRLQSTVRVRFGGDSSGGALRDGKLRMSDL